MKPAAQILRRGPMNNPPHNSPPPDQLQRERALDPTRSILVQAPAGSGKTDLLTRRFLRLLAQVEDPGQIVAITFTIAAAAEMRHRILSELEKAAAIESESTGAPANSDQFAMSSLARRALDHSNALGWKLLDLPAQLRISTIDSFCRDLALQQPLLSELGGGLAIAEQPNDLYRRAARHTLEEMGNLGAPALSEAVEALLVWRDNNWQDLEDQLVQMLEKRDRWMQDFVLSHDPDWDALRDRLERPFANAVYGALTEISLLLDQVPDAREEALLLARFACSNPNGEQHRPLAELADFPVPPFPTPDALEEAHQALNCMRNLLLTQSDTFRRAIDKNLGFPADRKPEKARILKLIADLNAVPGLEATLASFRSLPPTRYTEEDWQIVRACFTLLRYAAAQLKVVFAEAAAVDFIEIAQIALSVLKSDDGLPTDAAFAVADGIRHLLVDEFQDTSRRQHQLLARLIAAWPDRTGRTLFAVGDPMQSIYFFRDADPELFARVKEIGLEIPNAEPLVLDFVTLSANFRTTPPLVNKLNDVFGKVFEDDDGSGVKFSSAEPFPENRTLAGNYFELHLNFALQNINSKQLDRQSSPGEETSLEAQTIEIVHLIRSHQPAVDRCKLARDLGGNDKYRVAVLARTRTSLAPIAEALHDAEIPFRAVDLEKLAARPEVLDALALARALLNPQDRVAWLGVLRAPWCGLTLEDLHLLTSADDPTVVVRPIPDLLAERQTLLSPAGHSAAQRVLSAYAAVPALRSHVPTASLGTWLQQVWLSLGGADCCDATARANLDLLWTCLDHLPAGEQDLLGPALDAALDQLTALPDPDASSDCGVQLMTIHKSKGLEFEAVIIPDLQAKTTAGVPNLLSWLERGLKPEDETASDHTGEITEFLIAPRQPKGEDLGKSKIWVDHVYRERESQETRRILYVAATRARDELHLFARPAYKVGANGEFSLTEPSVGLLTAAWPALEGQIRARFDEWKSTRQPAAASNAEGDGEIEYLAASASNLLVMPSTAPPPVRPTLLRRLPEDYTPAQILDVQSRVPQVSPLRPGKAQLYTRHEGGLHSRALGIAVHALLEELARGCVTDDWQVAASAIRHHEARVAAQVRAAGIAPTQAAQIAANALQIALTASQDPIGQWILSPHPEAASEVRWIGIINGSLTEVRVDRVFRAGLAPQSEGHAAWWIVDYKTAHAETLDPAATLPQLRLLFAPQLEAYGQVLRNLHGADAIIRAGLFYPRMSLFDWWDL
jgi:ATP-dependent helicase/nuclease subunit A